MQRLLSILLLMILWLPVQAQQPAKHAVAPPVPALPYTTGGMEELFKTYNRTYWDGKLPKTVVVWTALAGRFAETFQDTDGTFVIRMDVIKNKEKNVAKTTLLHEMCHIKTSKNNTCHLVEVSQQDCNRWLTELHRIMLEGAFDDLV